MNFAKLNQPPWRTVVPGIGLLLFVWISFQLWTPGKDVRDGRHDRRQNGIWLGHGWLGGDEWFIENKKQDQFARFREPERIRELASLLADHHITDVYPHLCPASINGNLPSLDSEQAERFLSVFENFRVMPWVGGVNGSSARYENAEWRSNFVLEVKSLLQKHPRFAGIHLNVEPLTSGDRLFLQFLEELRAALPSGKILSIAAYPPPTRWHPFPEVHWEESYFREVARRSDQLAVMMYDTSLHVPRLYQKLMSDWTREVLNWSEGKPVLLGAPTYDDADTDYHRPEVENLKNALLGIHSGLASSVLPANYQGVAIYCEWETDADEWSLFRTQFLKP